MVVLLVLGLVAVVAAVLIGVLWWKAGREAPAVHADRHRMQEKREGETLKEPRARNDFGGNTGSFQG